MAMNADYSGSKSSLQSTLWTTYTAARRTGHKLLGPVALIIGGVIETWQPKHG